MNGVNNDKLTIMNEILKQFTGGNSLFNAVSALLSKLNIKFDRETAEAISVEDLYEGKMPKYLTEALECIDKTYFIGVVNDQSLAGSKSADSLNDITGSIQQGGKYDGMFVFACDAKPDANLTRSTASALTRALNRISCANPVILFIRQDNLLSLSTCERMEYSQIWRQGAGEKLGKVSLLRNIDCANPHRGHHDILCSLGEKTFDSFDDLYKHWITVFSNELLTKKFYSELSDWYAWAVQVAKFPNDINTKEDDEKYNHEACIRLITRLIFVWFLKQKHLIPEEFFDEKYICENFIKEFNPHDKQNLLYNPENSNYYRLILQNLFFAVLNCPIVAEGKTTANNRHFRTKDTFQGKNKDFNMHNVMRYEDDFLEGGATKFVEMANKTVPYLNGGLFECLDKSPMFYDGFSERKESLEQLYLPDYLFFGDEVGGKIDLSEWYGDTNKKNVSARGVIDILKKYSFTIEENTPYDQEVSLDPELLGKVFENLLAAFNPETQTTARKQTGSFYTPREIVQYMVDESLVAHLKRLCGDENEATYRSLLSYSSEDVELPNEQKQAIMEALYNCKVLDPACGSGAFPMGILQQMVHVLRRLDPSNDMWKQLMIQQATNMAKVAFGEDNEEERCARLADIEMAFNQNINDPDYARKLYLIEHCIYGVDIQPIATQISKLRFFISLVVDQKPTNAPKNNFGIRPLPNLESNFVTANTLIPLDRTPNLFTSTDEIRQYEADLQDINHRIFLAKRNKDKEKLRTDMETTRKMMAQSLENLGAITSNGYNQLVSWNPFDQNASAPFFDSEWMFGVKDGFDVVIANPPYVNVKRGIESSLKEQYESIYKTGVGQYDLFVLFIELGLNIGKINCMIVPKPILNNENYKVARSLMLSKNIEQIITGSNIFENAGVESCIFVTNTSHSDSIVKISKYESNTFNITNSLDANIYKHSSSLVFSTELAMSEVDLMRKINLYPKFKQIFNVKRGVEAGKKDDSIIDYDNGYPLLRGQDVSKYCIEESGLYIEFDDNDTSKFKEWSLYCEPNILLRRVGNTIQCAYDEHENVVLNTIYCLKTKKSLNDKYLRAYTGLLNSKVVAFWFFKTFCNTDKLFPYIRVSQLEQIPIPDLTSNFISSVDRLVSKVQNLQCQESIDLIDNFVYHLYNLTYDEVLIIDPETPITREEYDAFENTTNSENKCQGVMEGQSPEELSGVINNHNTKDFPNVIVEYHPIYQSFGMFPYVKVEYSFATGELSCETWTLVNSSPKPQKLNPDKEAELKTFLSDVKNLDYFFNNVKDPGDRRVGVHWACNTVRLTWGSQDKTVNMGDSNNKLGDLMSSLSKDFVHGNP